MDAAFRVLANRRFRYGGRHDEGVGTIEEDIPMMSRSGMDT